jgi:hypothetical protein
MATYLWKKKLNSINMCSLV